MPTVPSSTELVSGTSPIFPTQIDAKNVSRIRILFLQARIPAIRTAVSSGDKQLVVIRA